MELWVIFSVLSVLIFAITNVIDKYIIEKWLRKPITVVIFTGIFDVLAGIAVFMFMKISPLSYFSIALALIAGIMSFLSLLFYFKAARIEEISTVVPLYQMTPLFVLAIAFLFLGEVFTPEKYIGIFLLIAGAVMISLRGSIKLGFRKAFWFMILASLSWALHVTILKLLLDSADFWTVFAYVKLGSAFFLPMLYFSLSDIRHSVKENGKKVLGLITFNETIYVFGILLYTVAVSMGYATLVSAFGSIQPFFVLLFAVMLSAFYPRILKEEIGKTKIGVKILSIVLIIIGAYLVAT